MAPYLTPLPFCEKFAMYVHSQCCYILLLLRHFTLSLIRIEGVQIGDHEIKIVNFADDTCNFTCLNRIQVTLKLYQGASNSKINYSKAKPYGLEHIKIELINQDEWNGHNFRLKYLELVLVSSITPICTE